MAKRAGNLMAKIVEPENLRLAFWKAARHKQGVEEVENFRNNLNENLLLLRQQLLDGSVPVGEYHYFTIFDPKERLICAASFRERVLHHAIMNICHPVFEDFQIYDSYATRPGKGQYAALDRARKFARTHHWYCKLDVRKYFDSIRHDILLRKLELRFKDKQVLEMFRRIISSYATGTGKGLPIGNLTSQYFANFYLGFADRFMKEQLRMKAYIRYMDDMVFFAQSREDLLHETGLFIHFLLNELGLEVKPVCLNTLSKGMPFLGYVVFPGLLRLHKNSRKRFVQKMKKYHKNLTKDIWDEARFARHVLPLIAFTEHAATVSLRRQVLCKLETG
jgi:RNA-directed DNA polymerase